MANQLKALNENVIFKFQDRVTSNNAFEGNYKSVGGIIVVQNATDVSAKSPRWAIADCVGDNVANITANTKFLIPALRWTDAVVFNSQKYWMTHEDEIVAKVIDDKIIPLNDYVIFIKQEKLKVNNSGVIAVVGNQDDVIYGQVTNVDDSNIDQINIGDMFIFNDPNFTSEFKFNNQTLSFVKLDEILAVIKD